MNHFDVEQVVHRELMRLPAPRAPHTLVPGVLEAIRRRMARPWYERPWHGWPMAWQVVSAAALSVMIFAIVMLEPAIDHAVGDLSAVLTRVTSQPALFVHEALLPLRVAHTVWSATVAPAMGYLIGLVVAMSMTCATCGAALTRVTLGREGRS